MSDHLHTILAAILRGDREHAVTRDEICRQLRARGIVMCLRDVQDAVAELQARGYRIVSTNHGRSPRTGYWVARYAEDVEYIREAARRLYEHAEAEKADADMLTNWAHQLENRPRPRQTEVLFA